MGYVKVGLIGEIMVKVPDRIKVKLWHDRYAPGMIQGRPVSDKWLNAFLDVMVENGYKHNDTTFLVSESDLFDLGFPERDIDEIYSWGQTVIMNSFIVGNLYGYNAVEAIYR